jgi:hypothetical protein
MKALRSCTFAAAGAGAVYAVVFVFEIARGEDFEGWAVVFLAYVFLATVILALCSLPIGRAWRVVTGRQVPALLRVVWGSALGIGVCGLVSPAPRFSDILPYALAALAGALAGFLFGKVNASAVPDSSAREG